MFYNHLMKRNVALARYPLAIQIRSTSYPKFWIRQTRLKFK